MRLKETAKLRKEIEECADFLHYQLEPDGEINEQYLKQCCRNIYREINELSKRMGWVK